MPLSITLPNVRKLFITDPGFVMYEADLKGADAQVVAWEADDQDLKDAFRNGIDIHSYNAEAMWGHEFTKLGVGSHARDAKRKACKSAIHGINYGATPRTTAIHSGWLVKEAERFHSRWLSLHPGIARWHSRIRDAIQRNRTVSNAFGFRRVFFDRPDNCFTEALAWIPQSTVSHNTIYGALQLERKFWPSQLHWSYVPDTPTGLILQTHDSLNFQFACGEAPKATEIQEALKVLTPYADPLYIPWDLKRSSRSWGEMEKVGD